MKISIITATYNSSLTVQHTLKSLAEQRFKDFEHIIMDGASKDDTLAIVSAWDAHPMSIHSGPDKGIYDALNKGIGKATGDVIGFLHADDVLNDDSVLDKIAKAFEEPTVQAVYGDLVYVDQGDGKRIVRTWRSGAFEARKLRQGWMPPHPTFYARRSLYDQLGSFDLRYRIAADYDCMVRFLAAPGMKAAYIPEVLVRMRTGGISNRSLRNILQKSREDLEIARRNGIGGLRTIAMKNLLKISQFWKRPT